VKRTTVLLADDHRLLTDSLAKILQNHFEVVGTAHDGQTLVEKARQYRPNIVITDISMPQLNGIEAARIIRKELPLTKIVFLTMHNDPPLLQEAFRAGAVAFVAKWGAIQELLNALRAVAVGERYVPPMLAVDTVSELMTSGSVEKFAQTELTFRQRQILQLVAEGKTMREAGSVMGISYRTAECHKYEVMRKLGVKTTAALVKHAARIKLV